MGWKKAKRNILKRLCWDQAVEDAYHKFQKENPDYTRQNRIRMISYIFRLNKAQYLRENLETVRKPLIVDAGGGIEPDKREDNADSRRYAAGITRCSVDGLVEELAAYDVVSFDIFDTALFRKVEFPNDVFAIMAMEMGHNDFAKIRKQAENLARERKEKREGHREILLSDIYNVLRELYGIPREYEEREKELEIALSLTNPYILSVYNKLRGLGKRLIFISDMYLPRDVIERMLARNGYEGFEMIFLSNEWKARKGDGTLQKIVMDSFPAGTKVIHVGDSLNGDVKKSEEAGMDAFHNPDSRIIFRESDMDNMAGSFYRAVIQENLNGGMWTPPSLSYEHGFRVGGILALGFCEFLNRLAQERNIDKILFCARDCDVLYQIYNGFCCRVPNAYVQISRYAIMSVTSERYLYDWAHRYILRAVEQIGSEKTIADILDETGFGYLTPYLEDDDIDRFLFGKAIKEKKIEEFILSHAGVISKHQEPAVAAAKKYFAGLLGDAKRILVVDVGWSGSCITMLRYFLQKHFGAQLENVQGALLCTSRNRALTCSLQDGTICSYVYSPFENMDLAHFMMPAKMPAREQDFLHMPLEMLFTSAQKSLVSYQMDADGTISFVRTKYGPANEKEIEDMQSGMKEFVRIYQEYRKGFENFSPISPYVAFNPLKEAIAHKEYILDVYKNFKYDAFSAPFAEEQTVGTFGDIFGTGQEEKSAGRSEEDGKKKILFVTPELVYTGAPRSLLRMAKVAKMLGYAPIVWSAKAGPFASEFEAAGISAQIVPEKLLGGREIKKEIQSFAMAVCNTIVTDRYVESLGKQIPVVWYIREATNLMDFCRNNPKRLAMLKSSKDICCVSKYAAEAIRKFNSHPIRIVRNSVEDETDMALPYEAGSGEKVKFVQFGTMEYRKGYDVLAAAYEAMPKEYRKRSELYFAGGFINSGSPYCSYLFSKIDKDPAIHYLGVVKGEKNKIETLSGMDVVVVASRDESCLLVALEGAMLSKPLIVTENVGAKYMLKDGNGYIVRTGDVESLKQAMMSAIDNKKSLV